MSYQVLARKWRPKNFQQLMGQEHVVNVLVNALSQQRLHHAYLFTGTRGVGKTTIARIFAKSLNCEIGITDKPCGQCDACIDIDQGRFVDLLEIDAASKTKVDDTREILDNVQYAPSRGRFKVYLIDEVHMLSRHSFNALLKTLEEPPEHVKFILATTDPQKLPITVLSRCLQFHLKALTVKQIEDKLSEILSQEQVNHEQGCLTLLAKAARGSMRDSLSLTDQAIAQGQGNISLANIQQMLGGIDQHWVYQLVIALLKQDSQALMALSQNIASYAPSYNRLFAELIQLFHQIALLQIVEQHFDLPADLLALLKKFSQTMSAEDVQLYYQITLNGRKDLPYASDEQAAFDMTLLRLLAFKPMQKTQLIGITAAENTTKSEVNSATAVAITEQIISAMPDSTPTDSIGNTNTQLNEPMFARAQQAVDLTQNKNAPLSQEKTTEIISQPPTAPQNDRASTYENFEKNSQDSSSQSGKTQQTHSLGINTQENNNLTVTPNKQEGPLSLNSPVGSVLATRNMLRSRKKALEKQGKKSDGATMRQSNQIDNSQESALASEAQSVSSDNLVKTSEPKAPFHQDNIDPATVTKANQVDKWAHMIDSMQLTARVRQLAIHATISENSTDDHLILKLDQATRHLKTEFAQQQLQSTICAFLSRQITVTLEIVEETVADPYQIQAHIDNKRLNYAKDLLKEDRIVLALQETFQATLNEESISPR
ncbi:MAG: DNA polymerase III subunit gamma/tau [Colwellia sp.]